MILLERDSLLDSIPLENEERQKLIFNEHEIIASSLGRIKTSPGTITYGSFTTGGYFAVVIGDVTVVVHRLICIVLKPINNPTSAACRQVIK